jgi:hypothetical protein
LGTIAGVTEMTSRSSLGSAQVVLQFDLNRNIDGAARDVQAAIAAARADLPSTLKTNPTYRKMNPADAPILILALTSPTRTPDQIYDAVSNIVQQKLLQVQGVGNVELGGAACRPCGSTRCSWRRPASGWRTCAPPCNRPAPTAARRARRDRHFQGRFAWQIYSNAAALKAADFAPMIIAGATAPRCACPTSPAWSMGRKNRTHGPVQRQEVGADHHHAPARRQHRRNGRCARSARFRRCCPLTSSCHRDGPHDHHPRLAA